MNSESFNNPGFEFHTTLERMFDPEYKKRGQIVLESFAEQAKAKQKEEQEIAELKRRRKQIEQEVKNQQAAKLKQQESDRRAQINEYKKLTAAEKSQLERKRQKELQEKREINLRKEKERQEKEAEKQFILSIADDAGERSRASQAEEHLAEEEEQLEQYRAAVAANLEPTQANSSPNILQRIDKRIMQKIGQLTNKYPKLRTPIKVGVALSALVALAACGNADNKDVPNPNADASTAYFLRDTESGVGNTATASTAASPTETDNEQKSIQYDKLKGADGESLDPVFTVDGEEITLYERHGGYREDLDNHYRNSENDDFDENRGNFRAGLEGETPAEQFGNFLKYVGNSPEETLALRVAIGLDSFDSMDDFNKTANEFRELSDDEYDEKVNEATRAVYEKIKEGNLDIRKDKGFVLRDAIYDDDQDPEYNEVNYNRHTNTKMAGEYGDDGTDEDDDVLTVTVNGINIFDQNQNLLNMTSAEAVKKTGKYIPAGYIGINAKGNWVWRAGATNVTTPETPPEKPEEPEEPVTPPEVPPTTQTGGGNLTPEPTPTPTLTPEQPFVPETPEEKASKDNKNAERIDNNAATGMAGAYDSTPVQPAPVAPVGEQPVTGEPSGGDYEGTDAAFVQNKPSKGAEIVGVQPAPAPIPETPVDKPVGPAQPDYTPPAQEVEAPSTPEEAQDILSDLGIR